MGDAEAVRASRDGDRFHYYWAARRTLRLLDLVGDLQVVGVEGLPAGEVVNGEEVIDVAEYYGGRDAATCTRFRYVQLKHSTMRTSEQIVASELSTTLRKFAQIYRDQVDEGREAKLEFALVANRTLNNKVRISLKELAAGSTEVTYVAEADLLRGYMGFGSDAVRAMDFLRRFDVHDGTPGIADMEQLLRRDLQQFLPGGGTGTEMSQLMETVSRCATSLADKQTLEAGDILVSLRTTAEELFPAPSAIEQLDKVVHTQDVDNVNAELRDGPNNKLLLTAHAGVGKSVLTSVLKQVLPEGSVTVVYDCFAGGDYRKVTSQRHEPQTALTQISNELAAQGRCVPLIPTEASASLYTRVFMRRIEQVADQLARENSDALLTIVVDAADNAALAALEQQRRTFVTQLFRENWPANARLVQLCRPERKNLLDVPKAGVTEMQLSGFQKLETLEHLRTRFANATEENGAELHALSDGNPRVQAMAMENAASVAETVSAIQIAKNRPGDVLDSLLAKQVQDVADQGHLMPGELSRLCEALATLHPPMPLSVLAEIASVPADAIRSFAVALGRGLHAAGNTLQFRDEPTETWFRSTYGLTSARKREFAVAVKPFAGTSPYVASTLPQLLFEADMPDELVDLALSDTDLPGGTEELQAQQIARARAQFALCAMLRIGRHADAALLAVKSGDMSSGHSRKINMFRTHTDLAARFLDADVVDALCSSRELATTWPGSNLHVEAALFSHIAQFKDLARSRLRSAFNNFVAILRLPRTDRLGVHAKISANEFADLAMVAVNIDGPRGGGDFLARFRHRRFAGNVAAKLCARLADAARYDDLAGLIVGGGGVSKQVQVAVVETMYDYNVFPPHRATKALVKMLRKRKKPFENIRDAYTSEPGVRGVIWAVVHGLKAGLLVESEALRALDIHLPIHLPDGAGSHFHTRRPTDLLLGHALRARLTRTPLKVEDIASEKLVKLMKAQYSDDHYARDFKANIPGLLPWAECWVSALLDGDSEEVASTFEALTSEGLPAVSDHNTPFVLVNTIADIGIRILTLIARDHLVERFASWHRDADEQLTSSRLLVARIAARSPHLETLGLEVVTRGVEAVQRDRTDADIRVESLISLARTLLAGNESEARAIFDEAVSEAELVGDDLYARWQSLTNTARVLATGTEPGRAYRLFQIGEELDRATDRIHTAEFAERLRGMHEPTYLAATSRARDRRTLPFGLMITPAFRGAAGSGPERLGLLALYAFEPRSAWRSPIDELSPKSATVATSVFEAFTRHERSQDDMPRASHERAGVFDDREAERTTDPAIRFANLDFTTEDAWNNALSELTWRSDERTALVGFAIDKHPNRRPEVLDALGRAMTATETDFACLARAAAQRLPTLALNRARERLATTMAVRFARAICTRAYDDTDVAAVAEATGIAVTKLREIAFRELGRSAHQLTYEDYFYLAAHLANTLDTGPAGEVFDALAGLFEDLAPSGTSSDGSPELLPSLQADSSVCVAGLIWAALGDMASEARWQAAHAVLLLVKLNCNEELHAIARFADGTESVAPFVDSRFPFYELHARMWLLLAVARASKEPTASILTIFTRWLIEVVRGPYHAANQLLAQQTLVELSQRGLTTLQGADADVLTTRVVAEWAEFDDGLRRSRRNPLTYDQEGEDTETGRSRFFFDFESYWCDEVAEIFGSTEEDVARRAAQVATKFDGYDMFAANQDPRSGAGVYDSRRSYPDHSSWPGEDSHSFYMAVHALLTVAAELAETEIAHKDPELDEDSYTTWLARFLPNRRDGRWLADRRDCPPSPSPERHLAVHEPKSDWPWTLSKGAFGSAAGVGRHWVTVRTFSEVAHGGLSETTSIQSALVPHETARSLLIALQTSPAGPFSFNMPIAGEPHHDRPDRPPFEVVPWLDKTEHHYGIDRTDQRAADIRFPPTRPGEGIISRFSLTADDDQRRWFHDGIAVFRSRVWSDMDTAHGDHETGARGERLEVDHEFLKTVLKDLDMTLALQVGIRRQQDRPYYERRRSNDDEFDWLEWSANHYLIDPRGRWLEY